MVVAIIGIIAAVAWPAFESQSAKNRRADAAIALTSARQALIAYRSDTGSYPADDTTASNALQAYRPRAPDSPPIDCKSERGYKRADLNSCQGYYTLAVTSSSGGFSLTATPNRADPDCGNLTLDHLGKRDVSGSDPVKRCWAE